MVNFVIPFFNRDLQELKSSWRTRVTEEKIQKRLVLVIVSIALLLDNMLYMVIVPIIPHYLRMSGAYEKEVELEKNAQGKDQNVTTYEGEGGRNGWLFASKAILQLLVNPFSGTLIDRIGYEVPMMIGLSIMFVSTSIFAMGQSYGVLFFARCIQGLGSAFADTSGLAMIADRFTDESERSRALGIAIAFISFGSLVAPPFGGYLYEWFGDKSVPFVLLALVCLADAAMVFMVIHPKIRKTESGERLKGTPIWRLFMDPYISVCAGGLIMANVSLAFIEPTISNWMAKAPINANQGTIGFVWLPAFFPHVAGVYFTIYMMEKYPGSPWVIAVAGLATEGVSCFILPYCTSTFSVIIPLCILCFGIALIDTSILPLLGFLVDTRHVSIYGSIYAIADISYSLAYAIGPVIAGNVISSVGFKGLNIGICLSNLLYSPVLALLRTVYQYRPMEGANQEMKSYGLTDDPSNPGYGATELNGSFLNGEAPKANPDQNVEWKGSMYERKVKKSNPYRGYKDTDNILGSEEEEEEEEVQPSAAAAPSADAYKEYQGYYQGY